MKTAVIIFMIVASVFAIATLVFVVVDLILEHRNKNNEAEENEEDTDEVEEPEDDEDDTPAPVVTPVVLPEIVEQIDAVQADEMLSDEDAAVIAESEEGAGEGYKTFINIGDIDANFEANDVVTLALLKEKNLVDKRAQRIKILADGILSKPLTVKAESFSIQAMKMIELTGGKVIVLK